MKLVGQTAIVTGGASGLGQATAQALAAAGARIAIFDLNKDAAEKTARELDGAAFVCDVSSADSAERALSEASAKLGAPRILVNCAGIVQASRAIGRDGPLALEAFARVVNVNLVGTFNMIRLTAAAIQKLDPLEEGERGVIINTASVAAFDGQIGQAAYAASKGGVYGLTLPLAREFAQTGIRVVTIAPGLFKTPMMAALPPAAQDALVASALFPKRLGEPSEFGALARHICENVMLNGETIRLDGAIRLAPR